MRGGETERLSDIKADKDESTPRLKEADPETEDRRENNKEQSEKHQS